MSWMFLWNLPVRLERSTSITKFSSERCEHLSVSSPSVHTRVPFREPHSWCCWCCWCGEREFQHHLTPSFSRVRALHRIHAKESPASLVRSHAFILLLRLLKQPCYLYVEMTAEHVRRLTEAHVYKRLMEFQGFLAFVCSAVSLCDRFCHYIIWCAGCNSECVL